MAHLPPMDRISFGSLEDDQFFSACSSRLASRHVSVIASQDHLPEDANSTARPSEPLVSVCLPPVETAQPLLSTARDDAFRHEHSQKHHHFCPTALRRRLSKAKAPESSSQLDITLRDENSSVRSSNTELNVLVSSPAPVVTTRRWSSVLNGDQALTYACQGSVPVITRAQLDGHVSKQGIDGIVCNIRAYLSGRRHDVCTRRLSTLEAVENKIPPSSMQSEEVSFNESCLKPPTLPADQYLVTTNNIAGILDIVIAGMRSIQDENVQTECLSLLFPNDPRIRPVLRTKRIVPAISAIADPATTICSVQPCFNKLGREIVHDADTSGNDPQELSRHLSIHNSPRRLSWPQSPRITQKVSFKPSPRCEVPNPFDQQFLRLEKRPTSAPIPERPSRGYLKREAAAVSMTSFPKLTSRSCTNDWLTPLGLFDDIDVASDDESAQRRTTITDLYNRGIDAHSGVFLYNPLPILEEDPRNITPLLSHAPLQEYKDSWSCQADESDDDRRKRVGHSTESALHRRISVGAPHDEHQDVSGNLLDRLRRYSFMPLLDQTPESIRSDRPPQQLWAEIPLEGDGGAQKRSSQAMLRKILDQFESSPMKPSYSKSSSEVRKGTEPQKSLRRRSVPGRVSCSEDTIPHICVDEQWSPWTEG
ncbi:hypothetical protein F5Y19DRAFT_483144 [Xylariaceae sp. FL1651]|nr:hypothetical protein F5Y19DRAFT_483144 [Xylariaceae sp. FL1651]